MFADLVYDVGMHNGDDTAFYLEQGYRVVAIEANPQLIADARSRFADALREGRLTLIHAGVFDRAGQQTFCVNLDNTTLSSFDREMAAHWGGELRPMQIDCVRFADVLAEHGVPHYLKVDVEGADHQCLAALSPDDLPKFVSAEAHSLLPLCQLRVLGYAEFKCIAQRHHNDPQASQNTRSPTRRLLAETARAMKHGLRSRFSGVPVLRGLWATAQRMRQRRRERAATQAPAPTDRVAGHRPADALRFPAGSSGPFGEATFGPWRTFDEVAYDWLHLHRGHEALSSLRPGGWFDFHARRSD